MAVKKFSEACREAREKKGWTYLQAMMHINRLCEKRDQPICTERSLRLWEMGHHLPKIEAVTAMAQVYGRPDLIDLRIKAIEFLKTKKAAQYAAN